MTKEEILSEFDNIIFPDEDGNIEHIDATKHGLLFLISSALDRYGEEMFRLGIYQGTEDCIFDNDTKNNSEKI